MRFDFERLPLSYAQQRQWFLWQLEPGSAAYHVPAALRLKGALDLEALRRSFEALIDRHESLRTTFRQEGEQAIQVVHPGMPFELSRDVLEDGSAQAIQARVEAEIQALFDLERGPLLRVKLLRLAEDDHVLVLTLHHIVSDGWSMPIMVDELVRLYAGYSEGREVELPELPIQYADYAFWQRSWMEAGERERQLAYWLARLGGEQPVLELPADRSRPVVQSHRGARVEIPLAEELGRALKELAQRQGVTLFMLLLASFQSLLHRYSGQSDIRVGVPIANRTRVETEGLIGFFVNTQVLKAEFDLHTTFDDLLQQVKRTALEAQAHQDLPFEQLVEALQPERNLSHSPLFQVMYNHQSEARGEARQLPGLRVESLERGTHTAQFDLTLDTFESELGFRASLTYATDLFERPTVERLARHWRNLLEAICAQPGRRVAELPLLDDEERRRIVRDWNRTEASYPNDACVHELVEAQVERAPEAVALIFGEQELTYRDLNRRANRLAHKLRERGVGPDVLVGIALERSPEMVVGLLAILKAGGAYVPLDPEYPQERLAYMMEDSRATLLLTQGALLPRLPMGFDAEVLLVDRLALEAYSGENPPSLSAPGNLAYSIYTSGSTGRPKGVLIEHRNVSALIGWAHGVYSREDLQGVLASTSICFDLSVWELFVTLSAGGYVVLAGNALELPSLAAKERVRLINTVPSAIKMLCDSGQLPDSVRIVNLAGEPLAQSLVESLYGLGHIEHVYDLYGPSEDTTYSTYTRRETGGVPNIGRPISNSAVYLLDGAGEPVAVGHAGELCMAGAGLARGYLNRPSLTAEKFLPDPFDEQGGGRLYRTGDLARYRPDGVIEYLGRIDHQVKVRGFRIELGEIEARLLEQAAVREAVVLALDGPSGKQLVGYVVPTDVADRPEAQAALRETLRAALKESLPDYMVPAHLLFLDRLPLTPNGKLDRKALPQPDASQMQQAYVAPRTELEQRIAAIWQDVLKLERVGLADNFFELGGDSIISLQVVSRARQAGIQFTPKDLFQHQTVQGLAAVARRSEGPVIDQGAVTGVLPLTPIQQWFFEAEIPERHHWNQSVLLKPGERIDPDHLRAALQALVEHHDALRLRFEQRNGAWQAEFQGVAPVDVLWTSHLADLAELEQVANEAQRSLSLENGPLLRAVLAELPGGSQRLLLVIHHLVVDGVSWRVLLEDLQRAYRSLGLPAKTSSFKAWAEHLQAHAFDGELAYWQAQLQDAVDELPCDHPEGGNQQKQAAYANTRLDRDWTRRLLQDAPAAYRTQVNDLLLAALARVIGRWTGQPDVLVRLEGHGREDLFEDIDLTRTVGWFTSMYPVKLSPQTDLSASIKTIKEQLRAVPNKGIGYGLLRYLGTPEARQALQQLPQGEIVFNYLGQFDGSFDDETALFVPAKEGSGAGQSAEAPLGSLLSLNGQVYDGELSLGWTFSRELFDERTILRLADDYAEELKALIEHCCREEVGGVTPSDFPLAGLSQAQLDNLPIPATQIADIYPLSPMQQGMLFHSLYEQEGGDYINQMRVDVDGLDVERFRQAWQATVDGHEVLRANFVSGLAQPLQVVRRHVPIPFEVLDWRGQADLEESLATWAQADRQKGFDLAGEPLLRLTLVRTAERRHHLIYTNHHILMDGWSNSRLLGEVLQRYAGQVPGRQAGRYRDYIAWLQRQDPAVSETFWKGQLAELDEPTRLVQAVRPNLSEEQVGHGDHRQVFDREHARRLGEFARAHRVTVNTLVQAAWLLLLQRYTGQETVTFGATVAGRPAELVGIEEQVGLFINTLPVIGTPRPEQTVAEWIGQVQERNLALREFEHTPLYEVQRWAGLGGEALFDSLVVFENYPVSEALQQGAPAGLSFGEVGSQEQTNYPLTLAVVLGETLTVHYSYDCRYFDARVIGQLARHFGNLLEAICAQPERRVAELPMLGESERRFILAQWDQTRSDYPSDRYVHQLIEDRARQTPAAVAVIFGDQQLTYGQLDAQANRLAHRLIELGVGPEVRVAIAMRRSAEIMVAFLAVLKAGGAYVPLDVAYPQDRLLYMMKDCAAALVLTQGDVLEQLPIPADLPTLAVDQSDDWRDYPETAPCVELAEENLAYVIYTSGSTGQPKGVAVSHGPLVSHIRATGERYETNPADCELHFMSFAFDGAHEGWMHPLINGARVLIRDDSLWLPEQTYAEMHRHGVTLGVFPPVYLQQLAEHAERDGNPPPVRVYCFGGDAVPQASYDLAWRALRPQYLFNGYGPTETVVTPLLWKARPGDACGAAYAPIGTLLGKRRGYVLDADLNLLPVGLAGELYLGGEGVARGYLDRPGLTAERFVPDPFGSDGERVYRSGDLTRARADGLVDYLGRVDHQVKVRGFRIELGEIEARLLEQAAVREAVVLAQDGPSGKQLVGYVVPAQPGQDGLRETLRAALKAHLPDYMVPAHLLFLDRLPLTPNGKLDRKALPQPDANQMQQTYVAPRTELEQQVAAIWAEVLKIERVGLADNFFELGGDSIISLQVVSRARQAGIQFTPKDLFQHQTVQGLAAVARRSAGPVIDQGPVTGVLPLTPIQQWFFEAEIPERHHWNQSVLLAPRKPLEADCLKAALLSVLEHHDALRSCFERRDGEWQAEFQSVAPMDVLWTSCLTDLAELEQVANEAQRSLSLENGPLLRAVLAELPDGGQRLLLVIHHLVVDGVSWRVLLEDLQRAYQSLGLPAKTSSFKAWAEHLQAHATSPVLEGELAYWQAQLQGVAGELPCDHPEGGNQQKQAAYANTRLDRDWTRRLLQEAPAAYRTQVNDLLLAALARVIGRWTGQPDVLVRLEGHGREDLFEDIDLTRTVGWFTTVYPVKLSPQDEPAASIKTIKEQLRAVPNKGIGYGLLRYLGTPEARQALQQLPQGEIVFNYLGQFDGSFDGEDGLFIPASEQSGSSLSEDAPLSASISLNGQVYDGELSLGWTFSRELFDERTILRLADDYAEELKALIEHCCREESRGVTPSDFPLAGLSQAQLDGLPTPAAQIADIYPLSPMQQGMLFHSLYEQEGGDYINQMRVDVDGLDVERFRQVWQAALEAHDILRTGFVWQGELEQPIQIVHKHVALPFIEHDWRGQPELQRALDALAEGERRQGFDLTRAPLLRLVMVRVAGNRHHLIYTNHHILMDGWSNSRLLGDVLQRYAGQVPDQRPGRYRDYIAWLQRQDQAAGEIFWKGQLAELDEPTRLAQAVRLNQPGLQAGHGNHRQRFDREHTRRLGEFARAHRVTVNTLVQAAWLLLLQRYTGQETVCFGATVAGRPAELAGIEEQVGLFINTLPVIGSPRPEQTVAEWIGQVQERNLASREFEHTPLYEVQRWAGLGGEALFDSLVVFENYPVSEALRQGTPAGLSFGEVGNQEQTNYPLTLAVGLGETLTVHYGYDHGHFDARTVSQLAGHFGNLLQALAADGGARIGDLPLLGSEERQQVVDAWNSSGDIYPGESCLHQLIEAQAEKTPEASALIFADRALTYRELNQRANRLARKLRELGVGPDVLVGIAVERGLEMVVGLLAVLKAGGAYVPLDPEYPRERLAYMLEDSGVRLVLSQSHLLDSLPSGEAVRSLCLDREGDCQEYEARNLEHRAAPENLAYVIYTSGSTGRPKGVLIQHRSLVNFLCSMREQLGLEHGNRVLQLTSLSFDIAGLELYLSLLCGACVVLPKGPVGKDPQALLALIEESDIDVIQATPATWRMLLDGAPETVGRLRGRKALCGGEALAKDLAGRMLEHVGALWNLYGPTETTIWSSSQQVEDAGSIWLGQPLSNTALYVLDGSANIVSTGIGGELFIGGHGLARGYYNRPALTAERFVPDPFDEHGGGRLYRTGDLVRYRPEGAIEYLGRMDHQVKIRGFRIELGEIEARLLEHEAVREGVVLAQDGPGGKQLVGYVVPAEADVLVAPEGRAALRELLRATLKTSLPEYMVPAHLLLLERLPLTPNGKIDRKALPPPNTSEIRDACVAPRTALERELAAIWADVLKLERVGLTDNFFELGGDSILAVGLVEKAKRLRDRGLSITLRDLMHKPTIAELTGTVDLGSNALVPLNARIDHAQPLFCIHGVFGTVFDYLSLARRLDGKRAVIGIQSRMLTEPGCPALSMRELARDYAQSIRLMQPEGPYSLMGWSLGAVISLFVARELESQGQEVTFLGMVDAPMKDGRAFDDLDPRHVLSEFLRIFLADSEVGPAVLSAMEGSVLESAADGIREAARGKELRFGLTGEELVQVFGAFVTLGRLRWEGSDLSGLVCRPHAWWVEGREADALEFSRGLSFEGGFESFCVADHYSILHEERFLSEAVGVVS
nr:non-ribosomal peptide synthase/polyketide synthase [Pseudomonas carbonaria]